MGWCPSAGSRVSASSGGNLAGSVAFRLYDSSTHCNATDNVDTVGTNGLLYKETGVSVSGATSVSVNTSNTTTRVTATTLAMYWRVTYTSTNHAQTGSSSVCVENIAEPITADGTVTFP